MRVAISGSSGLIGSALSERLSVHGHDVLPLRRGPPDDPHALWDPAAGWIRDGALDGVDAVVHLAGAGIADRRWTRARRRTIWESRVDSARLLVDHIAAMARRPQVLLSASAVGFYGSRGEEVLTEQSSRGDGFLAELCEAWEGEARRVDASGVRSVQMRTAGIVLARGHGALARMVPLFRLGLGGRLGSGRQWLTWIALADEVAAIEQLLTDGSTTGPVNVLAPEAVTNAVFTRALARQLHRPALLPVPAFSLRLLFGALAEETLLASQRARPARLVDSGFEFTHPDLDGALAATLAS
ncbi:MAG: TIGR01777 family oxidoreductase [Dehalococcoidia bacterium]